MTKVLYYATFLSTMKRGNSPFFKLDRAKTPPEVVQIFNPQEFEDWMSRNDTEIVVSVVGEHVVRTIFTGVDLDMTAIIARCFGAKKEPVVFVTLVQGDSTEVAGCASSYVDAVTIHEKTVSAVRADCALEDVCRGLSW